MTILSTFSGIVPQITFNKETRTITGTIVEFGNPSGDYRRIVMHEGALTPREPLSRVKMLRDHDQRDPVGFMIDLKGGTATFKIPEGENGDRALAEAEAGLRDGLSVGINVSHEPGSLMYDETDGTYHVYKADLLEVSLVAIPAFAGAGVTNVTAHHHSQEGNPMPDAPAAITSAQLDAALEKFGEEQDRSLEQRFNSLKNDGAPAAPAYESYGALIKAAVADKDAGAIEYAQQLAYTGATTTETNQPNTWVADTIRLIQRNRKITESFSRETLPDEGMTLEYMKLKSDETKVAKQENEGDDLQFGKIRFTSETAKVKTYGGYTEVTRQVIERANAAYVNTAFQAMDLEYARATEADTRALLKSTIDAQKLEDNKIAILETAGLTAWLDLLLDAADEFEDRGYDLEGAKVSKDVFKRLMHLEDSSGRRVMLITGAGVNQVGTIDLKGLTGELGPVRFELFPGAAANTGTFYNELAIKTWESAGAPWMVDHENNINLTKTFSKYGYMAQAVQHPDALLPMDFTAA